MIILRIILNRRLTFTPISEIISISLVKVDRCSRITDYAF